MPTLQPPPHETTQDPTMQTDWFSPWSPSNLGSISPWSDTHIEGVMSYITQQVSRDQTGFVLPRDAQILIK